MSQASNNDIKKKIIWVRPFSLKLFSVPPNWWWYARLEKRIKNESIKKLIKKIALGKLFYGGDWDLRATLFKNSDWIKNIKSLKLNYKNYPNCIWFNLIKSEINKNGIYKYKNRFLKNDQDIKFFFEEYIIEIVESLKFNGFIVDNQNSEDIPKALIGRNGDLIKTGNGCHRLAIIQEFGIETDYPIQVIGVHKKLEINGVKACLIQQKEINKYISEKYSVNPNY